MTKTMTCFMAETMILTATGLVAIENIKVGNIVVSTNPGTMETTEKRIVETYIREDSKLIHIVVNGEEIITTGTHPFYINKRGFVEAGGLKVGNELLDVNNNILLIEDYAVEITEKPTTVYNFQVEDFHTYFVGENGIWVHNADYIKENRVPKDGETVLKDKSKYTRTSGREKGATIYKGKDGNYYHRDTLHTGRSAELEVYNSRGQHIGTANPKTGTINTGTAVPGRKIKL